MVDKRPGPTWPDESDIQESVEVHREPPYYGTATGELICDPAVSDGAVRLYLYLSWRAGLKNNNIRSRSTMAADLGITAPTVRNRIKQLVVAGWVAVVTRMTTSGDQTSNHYHVFENRETSATWRKDFKPSPGETLQLLPPKPNTRKHRAGVGGRPKQAKTDGETSQDGDNLSLPVGGGVINSSYVPPVTQVIPNHLSSNQPTNTSRAGKAPAAVRTEPQSYATTSGKSDAELLTTRDAVEAEMRIDDDRRLHRNEQRALLTDMVTHLFKVSGPFAQKYVAMLEGRQLQNIRANTAWNEAAAYLKGAPVTADELYGWSKWYRQTILGGNEKLSLTSKPESLVSSILAYRETPTTPARATGMFAGTNYDDTYWERQDAAKASAK